MFINKKRQQVKELIGRHCEVVGQTVAEWQRMVTDYMAADKQFKEESRRIDELESEADLLRFNVERLMYKGAFLPAYREGYIDLLERLDRVANKAEEGSDWLTLVRPPVAEVLVPGIQEMLALTGEAFALLPGMIQDLLENRFDVQSRVEQIGVIESRIDGIEFQLSRAVYRELDADRGTKLELKLTIEHLSAVSDRIENVGDRISLISIKRQLA